MQTALGFRRHCGFIGVGNVGLLALGRETADIVGQNGVTTPRMALGLRSGSAVERGSRAAADSVGRSTCEAAGSIGQNGAANVVKRRWGFGWSVLLTRRGTLGFQQQRGSFDIRMWVDRRWGIGWDISRLELWLRTASGCRQQHGSMGVRTWVGRRWGFGQDNSVFQMASRTESGPRLVGAAYANIVVMMETAWGSCRWDVSRLALGRRSVWGFCKSISVRALIGGSGVLVEQGIKPSVGFYWQYVGLNGVGLLVWLLSRDTIYRIWALVFRDNLSL